MGPRLGVGLVALLVAVLVLAPSLSSGSKCLVQGCGTTTAGIRLVLRVGGHGRSGAPSMLYALLACGVTPFQQTTKTGLCRMEKAILHWAAEARLYVCSRAAISVHAAAGPQWAWL